MQQSPARTHRILHLSDPHLTGNGFDEDGVDAAAALDRLLLDARFVADIDVVVVSGDIADDGSAEGCAAVLSRVGRFAAERGIPHIYTTGNHDTREGFAAVLGSGHLDPDGADIGRLMSPPGSEPAGERLGERAGAAVGERAAVSQIGGLRVITLDSLVPGSVHGLVSAEQLAWLGSILAEDAADGSIVVLHHPPIVLESPPTRSVVLQNPAELGRVLAGTDVRAVLCGHLHLQLTGTLNGVPVWVTPGIVTRIDLTTPPHLLRAVKGAGASVIDLGGPFSPMFHTLQARDPAAGTLVYLVDPRTGQEIEDEAAATGLPSDKLLDSPHG
jgi:3',5'-cyclic-AMP phosphodiesterase